MKTVGLLYIQWKDEIDFLMQSELINKISCSCGKSYIGQTKQLLGEILCQHKSDWKPTHINKLEQMALEKHHLEIGHDFEFSNTTVLDMESNRLKRTVSEMVFIYLNDTVNLKIDRNNFTCLYDNLLNSYRRIK